jgi:multidrug resistance efflux pump
MTEVDAAQGSQPEPPPPVRRRNPLRRSLIVVLLVALAFFAYSLVADRVTPYTAQATIQAYVVRIAPEVSGPIVSVAVRDNDRVPAGTELFTIDPLNYEIAVELADADLAAAGQAIGGSTAGVSAAQAKLAEAEANLSNVREQAARVLEMVAKGIYAEARKDKALGELQAAEANVDRAKAELRQAEEALGPAGADNPQLRAAMAALEQAQWNLVRTTVMAPSDGVVTNLQVSVGSYAAAGQPAMTFIDANEVWIQADLPENSLELIEPGDPAEVTLDVMPGRIFKARVESIGWGVGSGNVDPATGLPKITTQSGWLRDPQRFPVRLVFEGMEFPKGVRYGSQVNIIIYADDSAVMDALGSLWIRAVAFLSYLS